MTKSLNTQYQEISDALNNANTPAEVDAIFVWLKSKDAKTVKFVVDGLENDFVKDFLSDGAVTPAEREDGLAEAKEWDEANDEDELNNAQAALQIVLNIAKIKGNEAGPAIKALSEEMKKLSSEEYNSFVGLAKAAFSSLDILFPKPAPKANPFADLKTPKQ